MKKLISILILTTIFSCTKETSKQPESKYVVVNVYSTSGALMASDTTLIK